VLGSEQRSFSPIVGGGARLRFHPLPIVPDGRISRVGLKADVPGGQSTPSRSCPAFARSSLSGEHGQDHHEPSNVAAGHAVRSNRLERVARRH
jgi:hypothetical protein